MSKCAWCQDDLDPQYHPDNFYSYGTCDSCDKSFCANCDGSENCPLCSTKMKQFLNDYDNVKKCTRCTAWYDIKSEGGCRKHPGSHEMPVDSEGRETYGYAVWQDYGDGKNIVIPYYYRGLFTCCKKLCKHQIHFCEEFDLFKCEHKKINLKELGCIECDHTDEPIIPYPKSLKKYNGGLSADEEGWEKKIDWNINPPSHYLCGEECVEDVDMPVYI
ncbi:hypothetical protein AKO1_012442 [Acrasis kona]|uniref:Uncharacterized protein n=1 Tax=Acrasis kona TaxID=1008807 RepID=A0AAW2YY84_9EUKA